MRKYLFAQARKIILNGEIERTILREGSEWFKVKNPSGKEFEVHLWYERRENKNSLLRWNCNCEYMGMSGIANRTICSHILAVFIWESGVRKKV